MVGAKQRYGGGLFQAAASTGRTISVSTVAVVNPPITTVANGFCTSAPAPDAKAIGTKPSTATKAVVSNALGRLTAPSSEARADPTPSAVR